MLKFLCVALVPLALVSGEYLYTDDQHHYNYNSEYASAYDNYKPRDYKFEYGVSDPHTGDHKSQWEVRENGIVRGAYSLLEADGTTRVVEYYADDTGFHADVKKIGHAVHAQPEYHSTPLVKTHLADSIAYNGYGHGGLEHSYGAPIAAVQHVAPAVAAPIEHIAPIAQVQHIAPVKQVIAPQLLERYAPAHYSYENYANPIQQYAEPIQHYAEPIHYQQAPEVHIAKVAPIQQYAKLAEPIHVQQAPIHLQQAPIHLQQSPIHLQQAPIHVQQAPIHLQQAPIHLQQNPIHIPEPIQHYAPEVHIAKQQVHIQPDVHYAKLAEPVHYQPAPEVHYSKIPEQIHYQQAPQVHIAKSQPIQHYAPANYLEAPQYAEPIQFKQAIAQPTYVESSQHIANEHLAPIHYAKEQYPIAPAPYVEQKLIQAPIHINQQYEEPQYIQKIAEPVHQQYSQPAYYEDVHSQPKQEYSQLSQIDQAILKYLANEQQQQQQQQQKSSAPQPTRSYGFNHGL